MSTDAGKAGKASGEKKTGKASGEKKTGKASGEKKTGKLTSKQITAKYVEHGSYLAGLIVSLSAIYKDADELAEMNFGKRGRPYKYTHSFMVAISRIRAHMRRSYRACQGMTDGGDGPEFTTICRRVNSLNASIVKSLSNINFMDVAVTLIPDSTGLTPATRSEYVRVVHKLRRGFLRLTIMINKETLEIVSFRITDDSVGETVVFDNLLDDALANMGIDPKQRRVEVLAQKNDSAKTYRRIKIIADGAYDKRKIFSKCNEYDIERVIRVRKDANLKAGGVDGTRAEAVRDQRGGDPDISAIAFAALDDPTREENFEQWKKRVKYGTRWLVEIVISAFKRAYGDAVSARKMEHIRQEILLKICAYNEMLRIHRGAAMRA